MQADADLPLLLPATAVFACQRACAFLTGDEGGCDIQRAMGTGDRPEVGRDFPYHFVRTPDGIAVGVSFACTTVRAHRGVALSEQRDEVRAVLAAGGRIERLPERLTLFGSIDLDWAAYRAIETTLLELLAAADRPLPVALLAGSALLSLCIGLTQIEARARREGGSPAATLVGGLEELRASGYGRLLDIAAGARYPRQPSLTYLAPPYTWLQLSRRPRSRTACS